MPYFSWQPAEDWQSGAASDVPALTSDRAPRGVQQVGWLPGSGRQQSGGPARAWPTPRPAPSQDPARRYTGQHHPAPPAAAGSAVISQHPARRGQSSRHAMPAALTAFSAPRSRREADPPPSRAAGTDHPGYPARGRVPSAKTRRPTGAVMTLASRPGPAASCPSRAVPAQMPDRRTAARQTAIRPGPAHSRPRLPGDAADASGKPVPARA